MVNYKDAIRKALLKAIKKQVYAVDPERRFVSTPGWMFDLEVLFSEEERISLYYALKEVASNTLEKDTLRNLWGSCVTEHQESCMDTGLRCTSNINGKIIDCSIIQPENGRYFLLPTDQIALAHVITNGQYRLAYTSKYRPVKIWVGDQVSGVIMPVLQGDAGETEFTDNLKRIVANL